jgi:hypothetical protein
MIPRLDRSLEFSFPLGKALEYRTGEISMNGTNDTFSAPRNHFKLVMAVNSQSRDRIELPLDSLSCLQQRFRGCADILIILVQGRQEASALVLQIIESEQTSYASEIMSVDRAFGSIAFYRR